MFHLNLRTAASSSPASGAPAVSSATLALNEAPWTVIDVDENDSCDRTPSTHSSEGGDGSPSATSHLHSPQLAEPQVLFDQDPYPHCPIFILSKGRSDLDRSTMATFIRDLVPFVLVVEENEAEAYSALLDRLVGQSFGFAGMVYSSPVVSSAPAFPQPEAQNENGDASVSSGKDTKAGAAGGCTSDTTAMDDLWDFPCSCCCQDSNFSGDTHNSSKSSLSKNSTPPTSSPSNGASATAIEVLAQRLSTAFHHGYVFQPPTQNPPQLSTEQDTAQSEENGACKDAGAHKMGSDVSTAASGAAEQETQTTGERDVHSAGRRRPTPAFILRNVNEIRSLFRIEVLPESNRGVSYVRNYILQVLVPRVMVGCGVDRSGNVEELCLSGPGEHSTLTPAALRSVGLAPEAYSALQNKMEMERYLDRRRSRATINTTTAAPKALPVGTSGGGGAAAAESSAMTTANTAHRPASPSLPSSSAQSTRDTPRLLHGLFGFYWVLDDDIYGFYALQGTGQKQQRITSRAMMREMESRLRQLRRNADVASPPPPAVPPAGFQLFANTNNNSNSSLTLSSGYTTPQQSLLMQQQYVFTSKEDCLVNNFITGGKGKSPTLQNYPFYYTTACFSLEYNRFALGSAPDALAVNSYNNIACLFNYPLLHNPPQMRYFPPGVPNVRRPEDALVGYLGHSMLWYRFAIREDYDFTLQLIARGLYTLRFRSLSFDVPQMMKVRGGMTDYYRNCHEEIRQQNDRFVLQWPSIAQHWVKGKDDTKRDDIRVRWDLLSPARTKYPGAFLYLNSPLPQLQPQRATDDGEVNVDVVEEEKWMNGARTDMHKRARSVSPVRNLTESTAPHIEAAPSPSAPDTLTAAAPSAPRDRRGGYVVERWRDINPDEARQHVGLIAIPNEVIHIGQTVAAIPPFFEQQPSVVLATIIERSAKEEGGAEGTQVVWTAVAQDVRGMPFLHIQTCYRPPEEGIVKAAERLDHFFAGISD